MAGPNPTCVGQSGGRATSDPNGDDWCACPVRAARSLHQRKSMIAMAAEGQLSSSAISMTDRATSPMRRLRSIAIRRSV